VKHLKNRPICDNCKIGWLPYYQPLDTDITQSALLNSKEVFMTMVLHCFYHIGTLTSTQVKHINHKLPKHIVMNYGRRDQKVGTNSTPCLARGVGYMQICDRICERIFCQNPHITYFSTYNGIFRIAYAKIMPNMQKFAYMPHISAYVIAFFSIFLVKHCFKTAKDFGGKRLPVFAIRR